MLLNTKKHLQLILVLLLGPLLLAGCGGSSSPALGSVSFIIALSNEFTVPEVAGTGIGSGNAMLTLNRDSGDLSGSVTVNDLTGAVAAAHIHTGIAGLAGGFFVTLEEDASNPLQQNVPAGTTLSPAQMTAMLNSEHYINVHTLLNGSGEIRGQIVGANQQVIRSELDGSQVIPVPPDPPVVTTATGIAYVTVDTSTGVIRGNVRNNEYLNTTTFIDDVTAVHIHRGMVGVNGGIAVTLTQQDIVNAPALWSIPDQTSTPAGDLYFNVHSGTYGNGEIRGQIVP